MILLIQIKTTPTQRLLSLIPSISIRAVFHTRFSRQIISIIAAVLLLLCQSAGVMAAGALFTGMTGMSHPVADSTTATPCHGTAATDDSGASHCPQALRSSANSSLPDITAADHVPVLTARLDFPALPARCAMSHVPQLDYPISPPLPIVLCRLLN